MHIRGIICAIKHIIANIDIICIIHIITIFRIIICFQGWYEGTIEGLGSSVGHSRSREQQQYTSIPDRIRQDNESYYRYPAALSSWWLGPIDDCHRTFSQKTDCSILAAHPCTWCVQSPDNWTEQNAPCVGPILAVPMFLGEHRPEK
jgi:hypothetical protein